MAGIKPPNTRNKRNRKRTVISTADGKRLTQISQEQRNGARKVQIMGRARRVGGPGLQGLFSIFFGGRGGGSAIGFECLKLAFGDVTSKDVQEVLHGVSFGLNSIDPYVVRPYAERAQ